MLRNERSKSLGDRDGVYRTTSEHRTFGLRRRDGWSSKLASDRRQRSSNVLFRPCQHVDGGTFGIHQTWFAGIGEEGSRLERTDQDEMADAGKGLQCIVNVIREECDRVAPPPALKQTIERRTEEPRAGRRCDTVSVGKGLRFECSARHH
jgi:hypothetical protein